MRTVVFVAGLMLLPAGAVQAQDVTIPKNIERLSEKAVETVNVTVDGALLQLAGKFLSAGDPEQRVAKDVIGRLKAIYVRSFEFAGPGQYSEADVESLRAQVQAPAWTKTASVRSKKEGGDIDVFFKMEKDTIVGLVVIAVEPNRLTFVNIVGPIDLDRLASLGGHFGIPKVDVKSPKK